MGNSFRKDWLTRKLWYTKSCSRLPKLLRATAFYLCVPGAEAGLSEAEISTPNPYSGPPRSPLAVHSQRLMNRYVGHLHPVLLHFLHHYDQADNTTKFCSRENQQPTDSPSPSKTILLTGNYRNHTVDPSTTWGLGTQPPVQLKICV